MTTLALTPAIIDINLLPAAHRPAQVTWVQIVIAAILCASVAVMIPLAFTLEGARNDAAAAKRIALEAEVEFGGLESELTQHRALIAETEVTRAQLEVLVAKRELFQGGRRPLAEDLFWLNGFGFLPAGARITNVAPTADGFRVDGVAAGPLDGIAYAGQLVEVGGFASARMSAYTPGDRGGGQFSVEVTR